MPNIRNALIAVAGAVTLLAFAAPAFASPGQIRESTSVFAQAGGNGLPIGTLANGTGLNVLGCAGNWCSVSGGGITGWVAKSAISLKGIVPPRNISPDTAPQSPPPNSGNGNGNNHGNGNNNGNNGGGFNFDFGFGNDNPGPFPPQQQPRPPRPQPQPQQQSEACFYSRTNFRGESFCVPRGQSYAYLPDGWDNAIRSVEVFGRARVDLCRDEDLEGTCATVRSSQSSLPDQLDRRVSSIDVY